MKERLRTYEWILCETALTLNTCPIFNLIIFLWQRHSFTLPFIRITPLSTRTQPLEALQIHAKHVLQMRLQPYPLLLEHLIGQLPPSVLGRVVFSAFGGIS